MINHPVCFLLLLSVLFSAVVSSSNVLFVTNEAEKFTKLQALFKSVKIDSKIPKTSNFDLILIFNDELIELNHILDLLSAKTNILFAINDNSKLSDALIEFSVDFDDLNTKIVDNFGDLLLSSTFVEPVDNILIDGIGHRLTGKNPLIFPVLTASSTAYSFTSDQNNVINEKSPFVGNSLLAMSALQTRNNNRVVFTGCPMLFSDEFINKNKKNNNFKFMKNVVDWLLQNRGSLRAINAKHHRQGEVLQHGIYRIKDKMVFKLIKDLFG